MQAAPSIIKTKSRYASHDAVICKLMLKRWSQDVENNMKSVFESRSAKDIKVSLSFSKIQDHNEAFN